MKNTFLVLLVSIFVSMGSAMAADGYYPAYHNNEAGPSIEELESAMAFVEEFGFTKTAQLRVSIDKIHAKASYHYISVAACLARDTDNCVSLGNSHLYSGGDDGITVLNLKFGKIGATRAYALTKLLKTNEEVVLRFRVYQNRPLVWDRLVRETTLDFGNLFSRAPSSFTANILGLRATSQFLD